MPTFLPEELASLMCRVLKEPRLNKENKRKLSSILRYYYHTMILLICYRFSSMWPVNQNAFNTSELTRYSNTHSQRPSFKTQMVVWTPVNLTQRVSVITSMIQMRLCRKKNKKQKKETKTKRKIHRRIKSRVRTAGAERNVIDLDRRGKNKSKHRK